MIPVMTVLGLAIGRLWATAVGGAVWAVVLVLTVDSPGGWTPLALVGAASLAAVNVAVGVGVHRASAVILSRALRTRSVSEAS